MLAVTRGYTIVSSAPFSFFITRLARGSSVLCTSTDLLSSEPKKRASSMKSVSYKTKVSSLVTNSKTSNPMLYISSLELITYSAEPRLLSMI